MKGSSLGYLLKTGFKNVYMNRLMSFASIGVLVACLMLIGGAILLSINVRLVVGAVEEQNELVAFLEMGLEEKEAKQVGEKLVRISEIDSIKFVSEEEAWNIEKEKWGEGSAFAQTDVDGYDLGPILPASYRIKLKSMDKDVLAKVTPQIEKISGVDQVNSPMEEATILTDLNNAISVIGLVIVSILAVVSVVIIANTIKITIFSRRKEISIMRLVGATNTFIKLPFIIEGMLIGLISALVAFGGLWVAYNYGTQFLMENPSTWLELAMGRLIDFKDVAIPMLIGFASAGAGLGVVGSAMFIRKHMNV